MNASREQIATIESRYVKPGPVMGPQYAVTSGGAVLYKLSGHNPNGMHRWQVERAEPADPRDAQKRITTWRAQLKAAGYVECDVPQSKRKGGRHR